MKALTKKKSSKEKTNKVLAIFVKYFYQTHYVESTYLSKGQDIHKLPVSSDIKTLLQL